MCPKLATLPRRRLRGAILDGVSFAVAQLQTQPAHYRRAILLLSETIDHGSKTTLSEALRLISDTNTTMYSFAFSSTRSEIYMRPQIRVQHRARPRHGASVATVPTRKRRHYSQADARLHQRTGAVGYGWPP